MWKMFVLFLVVMFTFVCATDPGGPSASQSSVLTGDSSTLPQYVEAPTFAIGDQWTFKTAFVESTTAVVEVTEEGTIETRTRYPGLRFHANRDGTIMKIEGDPEKVTPIADQANGWYFLQFPLHVGKKWTFSARGPSFDGAVDRWAVEMHVEKLTSVETKAGTFQAVELNMCWRNERTGFNNCGRRYWYAPSVKRIVKRASPMTGGSSRAAEGDFELVSYKLVGQ